MRLIVVVKNDIKTDKYPDLEVPVLTGISGACW
jgi:hypothetical protein